MNVKWKSSANKKPAYLKISLDLNLIESKIHEREHSFWMELFKSENLAFRSSKYIYDISKSKETILADHVKKTI